MLFSFIVFSVKVDPSLALFGLSYLCRENVKGGDTFRKSVILKRADNSVFQSYNLNARFGIGIDVSRKLKWLWYRQK